MWTIEHLREIGSSIDCLIQMGDLDESSFKKDALTTMKLAIELAKINGFTDALRIALRAQVELGSPRDLMAVRSEVIHVADALTDEITKRQFLLVPEGRKACINNQDVLGTQVREAFPSAIVDICEAGNCLAADCNTAAVFHLMRVVEFGLRALCVHLGLRQAKRGKGKYVPISYVEWETLLNQLNPRVDAKIERMKRGKAKQSAQEFYYPILQDMRGIRDAWRNHLMHTRAEYTAANADAICGHVKRLLSTLATKVSE